MQHWRGRWREQAVQQLLHHYGLQTRHRVSWRRNWGAQSRVVPGGQLFWTTKSSQVDDGDRDDDHDDNGHEDHGCGETVAALVLVVVVVLVMVLVVLFLPPVEINGNI